MDKVAVDEVIDRLRGGGLASEMAYALSNKLAVALGLQEAPVAEVIVSGTPSPTYFSGDEVVRLQKQVAELTKLVLEQQPAVPVAKQPELVSSLPPGISSVTPVQ